MSDQEFWATYLFLIIIVCCFFLYAFVVIYWTPKK